MREERIVAEKVDEVIYNTDVYSLEDADFRALRTELIGEYIEDLEAKCPTYASYREAHHRSGGDTAEAPHVPTSVFKTIKLISVADGNIDKWCMSSGTLGSRSLIGRDRPSLERLLGSIRKSMALFEEWEEEELHVIHLGPTCEDAGDVWFPYVMGLTEILYPTDSFASENRLDIQGAINRYADLRSRNQKIGLIGAPFAVKMFCEAYQDGGFPAAARDQVAVVTGGGWKTHLGEAIAKPAFRRRIVDALGLSDETRVRDAFNQVELNTVLMECEQHAFHVPPWLMARAMCPRSLAPLPNGQPGLLAYIDASASSYPCIIVGDDLGIVSDEPCPCGRPGDLLHLQRRIERGGDAGCAIALSQQFGRDA